MDTVCTHSSYTQMPYTDIELDREKKRIGLCIRKWGTCISITWGIWSLVSITSFCSETLCRFQTQGTFLNEPADKTESAWLTKMASQSKERAVHLNSAFNKTFGYFSQSENVHLKWKTCNRYTDREFKRGTTRILPEKWRRSISI